MMNKKKPKNKIAIKAGLREDTTLLQWGYRIINHGEQCFAIHEAFFYDETGKFHSYSETPLLTGFSLESLKRVYKRMGNAFKYPAIKAVRKKKNGSKRN